MKRNYALILFLVLSTFVNLGVWGISVTKNGIIYTLTGNETASVTGTSTRLIGNKTVVSEITRSGQTYRVNAISFQAFADQKYLRSLTVPEELDSIGMEAFMGCSALSSLEGLKSVKNVGSYAFTGTALTSVDWSEWTVKKMGHGVLSGCTLLESVMLPLSLTSLPEAMLSGCTNLKSTNLSNLTSLKKIEPRAFARCESLTELQLPTSLTTIEDMAFDGMKSLQQLELPDNVATIGDFAFRGCSSIKELTLPRRATNLGVSAFYGCDSLTEVTLPDRLTSITDSYVFDNCPALEKISISVLNTLYSAADGVLYNRGKSQIIAYPAGLSRQVHPVLPESTTPLAKGALACCQLDEEVCLSAKVTTLSDDAFIRTSGMKYLGIRENSRLATIGNWTVGRSKDLQVIELPATTKGIGFSAFVGNDAIQHVIITASTPPKMDCTAFSEKAFDEATLHVRSGQVQAYLTADGWKCFTNCEDDALTTEIETAGTLDAEVSGEPLYNVNGVRYDNDAKLPQGIYIRGGKKVIKL